MQKEYDYRIMHSYYDVDYSLVVVLLYLLL